MKIIKYKPTTAPSDELVSIIKNKYGDKKNFDFFFTDFHKSYSFCIDNPNITFIPFSAFKDEQLVAHIALIIDKRLPKGKAFFGFFETEQDLSVFETIWQGLIEEAKKMGILRLLGPVNGSIWHQYRCIKETDGSEYFKSEPMSESYYYKLLTHMKPTTEVSYYSASRDKFDKVIGIIQTKFEKLAAAGFDIKELKNVNYEQLLSIAEISRIVFHNSWGYTDLTEKEFLQLYSPDKLEAHLNKLYLLYKRSLSTSLQASLQLVDKDKQIIGYCGTSKEDEQTLILKTICILLEYQGLGLGNALAYKIHLDAQKMGFKKIIYALIKEGNKIKNFPKDDTLIFRRYAAFEFKI